MIITLKIDFTWSEDDSVLDQMVAVADTARALDTEDVTVDGLRAVVSVEYDTLNDLLDMLRGDRWTESDQTLERYPLDSPTGPV